MKKKINKKGFTLLELLVVVLIIGILAAVALPQYKKAVQRSKAAQVDVIISSAMKAIEEYSLVIGDIPPKYSFSGDKSRSSIETPGNCPPDNAYCFTDVGRYRAYCASSICTITFLFSYYADTTTGNKWLTSNNTSIELRKWSFDSPWVIESIYNINKNSSDAQQRRAGEIICPILGKYVPPNSPKFVENCL